MSQLPVPNFFHAANADKLMPVPYQQRSADALQWVKDHKIPVSAKDRTKVALMAIDCQGTFCLPNGELFVGGQSGTGAVDDCVRLAEFIYRNLAHLTKIYPTLDTHMSFQIFHDTFWVNEKGDHPAPATMISVDDVKNGTWRIDPAVAPIAGGNYPLLQRYAQHYTQKLADGGKYPLIIWPFHAMLGGVHHALVPVIEEAVFFHSIARKSQVGFEIKGGNPLTENYSVLGPEVTVGVDGAPIAQKNSKFFKSLVNHDAVIIAGQAKSHCVAFTIDDLLNEIKTQDPELVKKVYLLEDCTSSVVIPGVVDFTPQGDDAFRRFSDAGMHVVKSTTPMEDWEGIKF